jgi:histidine triad (HIT) family protein
VSPRGAAGRCVFCEILSGKLPAHTVFEDERHRVILDHRPLLPGHCLVLTCAHYETLLDVPAAELGPLLAIVQTIAGAMESALGADGSFTAINTRVSQSVPHLHVHVVPRREKDGLFARGMVWVRKPYESEQAMADMAARIARGVRA